MADNLQEPLSDPDAEFDDLLSRSRESEGEAMPQAPVGVSETARSLDSEGFFDRLTLQNTLDTATKKADAVAKSAGARGVLGESFGILEEGQSKSWLEDARKTFDTDRGDFDEFRGKLRKAREVFGDDYMNRLEEAGKLLIGPSIEESAGKNIARREKELTEREAGTRPLATKTPLRSATENVPQGTIGLAAGIVKGIGMGAGIAGKAMGYDIDADDNTVHSLGKWIDAKGRELFPGDQARQDEFTQKLAHGAGSMVGFYGPAIVGKILGASDKALIGITATSGALAESAETTDQALRSREAGREVTDGELAIAYMGGLVLGTTEAAPVAALFKGSRGGLTRGMVIQGKVEGIQEGGQTFGENLIAKGLHEPDRELGRDVAQNAGIGAILGTFMQGARYATSKTARQEARQPDASTPVPQVATQPKPAAAEPPETPDWQSQLDAALDSANYGEIQRIAAMALPKKALGRGMEDIKPTGGDRAVDRVAGESALPPEIADYIRQNNPELAKKFGLATGEETAQVGDLVQWTASGVDQFETPRKVVAVSPDGAWAFVEGSNTGVPVAELAVSSKAAQDAQLEPWQQALSQRLAEVAKPLSPAQRSALEADVEANLPAYHADMEDVYGEMGLGWDLDDDGVRAVGFHMAQGLTAEEALQRYAVEAYETERVARAPAQSAQSPAGGRTAPGAAQGQGTSPTGGQPAGARPSGPAAQGVGGDGSRPQGGRAAQQPGQPQRGVQQGKGQPALDDGLRQRFRSLLAGKQPKAKWSQSLRVDDATLDALIKEAVAQNLLRVDRNGVVRRTSLVRVTPRETPTRPVSQSLAIPADVRLTNAIRLREAETGKPVPAKLISYAEGIEESRGTAAFNGFFSVIKKAADGGYLKKADVLELAHLVGMRPTSKTSKADALASIEARHLELVKFLDQQARRADAEAEGQILAAIAQTGFEQKKALDALGFYSHALEAAKNLKQEKGTPEQMLAQLKNAGVKEAEIKATGLDKFLGRESAPRSSSDGRPSAPEAGASSEEGRFAGAARKSVSRQEIIRHLEENRVEVRESVYGGPKAADQETDNLLMDEDLEFAGLTRPAKWSQYSLDPSNPTYREAVISLPWRDTVQLAEYKRLNEQINAQMDRGPSKLTFKEQNDLQDMMVRRDAIGRASDQSAFKQGHFDEPNVIAHARTSLQKIAPTAWRDQLKPLDALIDAAKGIREQGAPADILADLKAKGFDDAAIRGAEIDRLIERRSDEWKRVAKPQHQTPSDMLQARVFGPEEVAQVRADQAGTKAFVGKAPTITKAQLMEHLEALRRERLAHVESMERQYPNGQSVFLVDELQSDWGQKIRDGGVRDEGKIAELEKRAAALEQETGFKRGGTDFISLIAAGGDTTRMLEPAKKALAESEPRFKSHIQATIDKLQAVDTEKTKQLVLLDAEIKTAKSSTPGHPLVNTTDQWTQTAFRRLIRQAVEAGAERIAIIPGKVAADRFNLARFVDELQFEPSSSPGERLGTLVGRRKGEQSLNFQKPMQTRADLDNYIGKEMADRLLAQPMTPMGNGRPAHQLRLDQTTEFGGSGMRATYDAIYPKNLSKLLKKMDPAIQQEEIALNSSMDGRQFQYGEGAEGRSRASRDATSHAPILFHTFPLTPKVKSSVLGEGQALFSIASQRSREAEENRIVSREGESRDAAGAVIDLAAREATARKFMETPEWTVAANKPPAARDTSKVAGYLSDAWKKSRTYAGGIVGFDAAVAHLATQAEAAVPGGFAATDKRAFVIIGYPGAGKSTLSDAIRENFLAAHITADDAKLIIPEYQGGKNSGGAHQESTDLAYAVARKLAAQGKSYIIETLGTKSVIDRRAAEMKADGYAVGLLYADVPKALAMERAVTRYQRDGRAVPLDTYDKLKAGEVYATAHATGAADETAKAIWDEQAQAFRLAEASPGLETLRGDIERVRLAGAGGARSDGPLAARPPDLSRYDRNGRLKGPEHRSLFAISAWHASRHDVERFDLSRVGTGLGRNMMGHGLYFAGVRATGEHYKVVFSDGGIIRRALGKDRPGRLYEVEIDTDESRLLDSDKPFSQQPKKVQEFLRSVVLPMDWHYAESWKPDFETLIGREFYLIAANNLAGNPPHGMAAELAGKWTPEMGFEKASRLFAQYGIDGLQFYDPFAGGKKTGARSFVVFRDEIIKIVAKDGKPVSAQEKADAFEGMVEEQQRLAALAASEEGRFADEARGAGRANPKFSEFFSSRLPEIAQAIESEIKRMLPSDVAVVVTDRLFGGNLEYFGRYNPDMRLLELALAYGPQKARQIGRHEVIHVLREKGLFTDAEWTALVERAAKIGIDDQITMNGPDGKPVSALDAYRGAYRQFAEREGYQDEEVDARVEELLNQERVAKMAELWEGGARYGSAIDGLLERIAKFFEAVRNALNRLGFTTVDDVFDRAFSGEIANRSEGGRREPTFAQGPALASIVSREGESRDADGAVIDPAAQDWNNWKPPHHDRDGIKQLDALARSVDPTGRYIDRATIWAVRNHIRGSFRYFRAILSSDAPAHSVEDIDGLVLVRSPGSSMSMRSRAEADSYAAELNALQGEQKRALLHAREQLLAFAQKNNPALSKATVFRWTSNPSDQKLKVGETFTDPAFMSTERATKSLDASSLDPMQGNASTVLRIKTWSGLDIEDSPLIHDTSLNVGEQEVLIPPGQSFAVTKVERNARGFTIVDLDELPPSAGVTFSGGEASASGEVIPLDLSPSSRKARAEAMGFDTSRVLYRGMTADVLDEFRAVEPAVDGNGIQPTTTFVATIPEQANEYAEGDGGRVFPLYLRRGRYWDYRNQEDVDLLRAAARAGEVIRTERSKSLLGSLLDALTKSKADRQFDALKEDMDKGAAQRLGGKPWSMMIELHALDPRVRSWLERNGYDGFVGLEDREVHYAVFNPANLRSVNAAFDPSESSSPMMLASIRGQLPQLGSQADPTAPPSLDRPEKSLSDLVADILEMLGVPGRHGRLDPGLKARAARQGMRVAGQFSRATGVIRTAIPQDFPTLVHEGGHALEVRPSLKTELDALKQAHREELTTDAVDQPMPALKPAGYSGLDLDASTQDILIDAATYQRAMMVMAFKLAAQKADPNIQLLPGEGESALHALSRMAGLAKAALEHRVGKTIANALIDDITGNPARLGPLSSVPYRLDGSTPETAGFKGIDPAFVEQYVRERYSATGTPATRAVPNPTAEELSEGFAEFFRLYVTNPDAAKTQAPAFIKEFEDLLDGGEPGMLQELQALQDGYQALLKASPAAAVRSRVQSSVRPGMLARLREEFGDKGLGNMISDRLYRFFWAYTDEGHSLKTAVKYLLNTAQQNLGVTLGDQERLVLKAIDNPYVNWRLLAQSKGRATATLLNGVILKGDVDPSGPSYWDALTTAFGGSRKGQWNEDKAEQFGTYLIARSMLAEFDRYDRGELENLPDEMISREVFLAAKTDLEAANPEFVRGAEQLYQFQRQFLKLAYQNQFITAEAFQDYMNRVDYVPRQRVMDEGSPSMLGASQNNKKRLIQQFKGSTRDFINPLESIAQTVFGWTTRFQRNDVIRTLDAVVRAAGPGGGVIAERIPAKDMRGVTVDLRDIFKSAAKQLSPDDAADLMDRIDDLFDEEATASIFRATDTNEKGEPIVYLYENGKAVPIRMGDNEVARDIFETFTAIGSDNSNVFLDVATLGTQALRFGVTKAVSYVAVNFLRDQLQTWALSENYTPFATGLKGLKHVFTNDVEAQRHAAGGGMMGGIDSNIMDTASRNRDVLSLRRKGFFAVPLTWPKGTRGAEKMFKGFLRAMETTEAGTRIGHRAAAYQRAIADGLTPEEAGFEATYAANDVMPFDRRGAHMASVSRLVAFLNAAVQGMSAGARTVSGERDTHTNYRTLVSPFIKATSGQPLSIAEKKAMPNSVKVWIKLVGLGFVGLALAALYRDDEEYEEFNDYMRATHWFFNIGGHWFRYPKPFELAVVSNAMEAAFARAWKGDTRALKGFLQSLKHTMVPPHELQAMKLYYEMATGKDTFRDRDIVQQNLKGLPPELQFGAYTSEFGKMLGRTFGWSPSRVDHFMAAAFGSIGRDILMASDVALPRLNVATGGYLPGVNTEPRAEKSVEDYWFASRFMRRSARGALSTEEFWKQMSQDGGQYVQAASGYKRLQQEGKITPRRGFDAQAFLNNVDDDRKAYAILEGNFSEKDKDINPLHRSQQVMQAISGMRRDMVMDKLVKLGTMPDAEHKSLEPETIVLSPSKKRQVNEILEDLSMREARNALIIIGHPAWKQKEVMATDGLIKELESVSPEVATELGVRLTKGRTRVLSFDAVREAWPQARDRLLKDGADASLADLRTDSAESGSLLTITVRPKQKAPPPPSSSPAEIYWSTR